jgi:tetratricopeptide (TPR) repeat protein
MTKLTLVLRKKNQLIASPAQITCICAAWLLCLIVLGETLSGLPTLLQGQCTVVILNLLMLFLIFQLGGQLLLSTLPLLLHYKRMTTTQYIAVDRCNRLIIQIWSRVFLGNSGTLNILKANWGLNRIWLGDHASGEAVLREVMPSIEKSLQQRGSNCSYVMHNNLSYAILKNGGSLEDAEKAATKAIDLIQSRRLLTDNPFALFPLTNLGVIHFLKNDYEQSEARLVEALSCRPPGTFTMEVFPAHTLFTRTNALLWLAVALFKQAKTEEAFRRVKEVCELISQHSECVTLECLDSLSRVARELTAREHFEESEILLELGYAVAADNPGFADNKSVLESYEVLLQRTDRLSEIADLKRWIRPIHVLS